MLRGAVQPRICTALEDLISSEGPICSLKPQLVLPCMPETEARNLRGELRGDSCSQLSNSERHKSVLAEIS